MNGSRGKRGESRWERAVRASRLDLSPLASLLHILLVDVDAAPRGKAARGLANTHTCLNKGAAVRRNAPLASIR